jgi:hypothetical protein
MKPKKPTVEQMLEELRNKAVGPKQPFDPIGTAKRNLTGMYETAKRIPGNIQRMVRDPVAYAKSIPAPTGDQIMNALGPGNVGMAGIMIGPKAKTWNSSNATRAEAMEKAGVAPEEIWYATGTYRGPGGAWRQEIDDSKAVHRMPYEIKQKAQKLADEQQATKDAIKESLVRGKEVVSDLFPKEAVAARKAGKQRVADIDDEVSGYFGLKADPRRGNLIKYGYEHPELYAAYPELQNYVFRQGNDNGVGMLGSIEGRNVNLYLQGLGQKNPGSTVTHELQHAIQAIEGTPRGGNTYEFMQARNQANNALVQNSKNIDEQIKLRDATTDPDVRAVLKGQIDKLLNTRKVLTQYDQIDPHQEYRKLGGEAESRMVQQRLDMTPEERAKTFPLSSYDVDPNQLRLLDQGEQIDIYKAQGGSVMGINVATDRKSGRSYADMIVDGHKTFESRNSDTLRPYVGKRVAIVRTGEGKAKAIGEVTIGEPMVVNKQKFRALEDKHHVPEGSAFDINTPTKHLYPLHDPVRYEEERDVGHGIVSRKVIEKAQGGAVNKLTTAQMKLALAKGGKVEVRPTVKDDAIQRKIPEMEEAAKAVSAGEMSHKDYDKVVNKHKPVKPYEFVPQPASDEDANRALKADQKDKWRGHESWPAGRKVGLRLDIPAYENHGVWVNSIHDEEGKKDDKLPTTYNSVSSVKNATFDPNPDKAVRVATGELNKSPFARIKGELHHMTEDEAVSHMKKYLNHPDYAQVGMDPRRHGYFYDRKTMQPVTHAKHVVQIGPLVLAHKPTYGKRESYAQGGTVKPFDFENEDHVENVASIAAKHKDFSGIPGVVSSLAEMLSRGSYKFIEDPRIQSAIKQAGHTSYFIQGKDGKQQIVRKALGGNVSPSMAEMKMALAQKSSSVDLKNVGVNEAPNMSPKHFFPPETRSAGIPSPGGVATPSGMPIGGIDMSRMQGGQQLMSAPPQPPQGAAPDQPPGAPGGLPAGGPAGAPAGPTAPMGNMLAMTPQGQTMAALGGAQRLAKGGSAKSVDDMKAELAAKKAPAKADAGDDEDEPPVNAKRITIKAEGPGGVTGIVVPHHMLHGRSWVSKKTGKKVVVPGMMDINKARAQVYGSENRDPLSLGQIGKIHKDTLAEHFAKSPKEQLAAEKEATQRLRDAKHLGAKNNTLDESEKLDTVRHETDEQGRTHVGFASKGVAGHALYTSGHGDNMKYHVINTCPGQTEGCGGGKDAKGVVDTSRGTCFAPNAESQYVHAAVRRATHEQAKHDPKMTRDWILAHTGSMREAAKKADKNNQRLLFRPNVVDETDVSSRHAIRHLNEQRRAEDKPDIIANSYGKTNELHDPENGYHVTHSNVGPKVKKGQEIAENVGRDKARVRNTVMAADNRGDFRNEQGNKTPPKGSYMVTDVKRGSPMAKKMEEHITHAKYWTTGRAEHELTEDEKAEGPEGHFNGSGRKTSEDKAHYGHTTIDGKRFDYQRQHILHPRLVNVPIRKKNKKTGEMETKDHMIPTDSRFKDTEFLPKDRFKTKNGKDAGHILMTTPTESTSNVGHETSFTHNVNPKHIEHAQNNNGEYEIDKPEDQIKAAGKEYRAPQPIKFYAEGGQVGRHPAMGHDDFHAFPELNGMAQRHLTMRRGDDEAQGKYHSNKKAVVLHKDMDTIRLEMTKKAK